MKLEATSMPLQKVVQASGGKNQNSETANQEFSDALKAQSGTEDKGGAGRANDTGNKSSKGSESELLTKKHVIIIDQNVEIMSEDDISIAETIEIPVDKQEGGFNENVPAHHSIFLANQTVVERLSASIINKGGNQPGKIAIDDKRQVAEMSPNLIKEQAAAFDMKLKMVQLSEHRQEGVIGNDILESLLKQKVINSKTAGIDADFKNLPANQINNDTVISADKKQTENIRVLSNLPVNQITGNNNASIKISNPDGNVQTLSVMTKETAPLHSVRENTIGEMKTGELKIGELKSADVKIGEVKLERIAPASLNQVIISALSSSGKISPISTNVIVPGQISSQLHKTLTIQLHPENLGVVEVKISDRSGNLSISVETNTLVAEKILKAEISVLSEKLALLGILHEEMTVRNNPGLDIVKDNNIHERNGGMNSNQAAGEQNANDGKNDFERQLHEQKFSEGKIGDTEQMIAASKETGSKRDGIYL